MSNQLIAKLADEFGINVQKPHFPVNTMRLYYLLLANSLSNGDKETTQRVNNLIPKISAVLDARESALSQEGVTPATTFEASSEALYALLEEVDTPQLRQTIEHMVLEMFPLQESLLASIDKFLKMDNLVVADLMAALKIRSMDSMLYASVIDQVLVDILRPEGGKEIFLKPIHWQVNITLQLNDLSDAIVYAKQDLESKNATLVEIIRRIDTRPDQIEANIKSVFDSLINQSSYIPLPEPQQQLVTEYNNLLRTATGA